MRPVIGSLGACRLRREPLEDPPSDVTVWDAFEMEVLKYPDWRENIVAGLEFFASRTFASQEWPDVTNAVHWIIDDTSWDKHPPRDDLGILIWNDEEATAVHAVVRLLLACLDEMTSDVPDFVYFAHPRAAAVRAASKSAVFLMRRNDSARSGKA
jgi:hypothetical protein